MPKETMTPRERWLAVLRREKPDRVPMDYWATGEATQKLLRYCGAHLGVSERDEVFRRLHIDAPVTVGPRYVGPELGEGTDEFGCRREEADYGCGVYSD